MSSDPDATPVSSRPARPRPPRLFAFAMVMCMALGFGGTMNGCNVLQFYHSTTREEPLVPDGDEAEREKWRELARARWAVFDRARSSQVPLAAANLVLSSLLLIVAWRALQGRPGTRGLAAQAVAANGAYTVLEYALSAPVRAAVVGVLVEYVPRLSLQLPTPLPEDSVNKTLGPEFYFALLRAPFVFNLATYTLSLVALSLPSVRAYLEDVAAGDNAEA